MHELSIAQSVVESALQQAKAHGGRRVLAVGVRVGDTSGVAADALSFCFEMTTKDTAMEGATLELERVAVRFRCLTCEAEFEPVEFRAVCPTCGSDLASMIAGDELALAYVELE
jgi:hydrogenase nickel incorporation protein HypA/HybF